VGELVGPRAGHAEKVADLGDADEVARLLKRIDELVARMASLLDEVRAVTHSSTRAGQGVPDRHHPCEDRVDEIRLRAHARPLDEPEP
jgi:C4-dicarboxylate-specific signal transduction histidine kinase